MLSYVDDSGILDLAFNEPGRETMEKRRPGKPGKHENRKDKEDKKGKGKKETRNTRAVLYVF